MKKKLKMNKIVTMPGIRKAYVQKLNSFRQNQLKLNEIMEINDIILQLEVAF